MQSKSVLVSWVLYAVAFLAMDAWVPGVEVGGIFWALIASAALGLANTLVRPILIFFTLPITLVTMGAFLFIVNAIMVWLVALLLPGFAVSSFWVACFMALVFWAIGAVVNGKRERR